MHRRGRSDGIIVARGLYISLIIDEALRTSLDPGAVFGNSPGRRGERAYKAARARWRVWRALYATDKYSLPGIGHAAGRHHTTVLSGIRKIELEEPVDNFCPARTELVAPVPEHG